MDDVIEARLGMSLDDLIKYQKKTTAMEVKKKRAVAAKGALKAKNAKVCIRPAMRSSLLCSLKLVNFSSSNLFLHRRIELFLSFPYTAWYA